MNRTPRILQLLAEGAGGVLNTLSDLTGIRYIAEPLPLPERPGCKTLPIPGYRQTQSYTCGFIVAANVLHYFNPEAELEELYEMLDDKDGTVEWEIVSALRHHGITTRKRSTLDFSVICRAIDAGKPIICAVRALISGHWIVIYGYDKAKETVFVSGNGTLPVVNRKEIPYDEFCNKWDPAGNGLVCCARKGTIIQPESKGRRSGGRPIKK